MKNLQKRELIEFDDKIREIMIELDEIKNSSLRKWLKSRVMELSTIVSIIAAGNMPVNIADRWLSFKEVTILDGLSVVYIPVNTEIVIKGIEDENELIHVEILNHDKLNKISLSYIALCGYFERMFPND